MIEQRLQEWVDGSDDDGGYATEFRAGIAAVLMAVVHMQRAEFAMGMAIAYAEMGETAAANTSSDITNMHARQAGEEVDSAMSFIDVKYVRVARIAEQIAKSFAERADDAIGA